MKHYSIYMSEEIGEDVRKIINGKEEELLLKQENILSAFISSITQKNMKTITDAIRGKYGEDIKIIVNEKLNIGLINVLGEINEEARPGFTTMIENEVLSQMGNAVKNLVRDEVIEMIKNNRKERKMIFKIPNDVFNDAMEKAQNDYEDRYVNYCLV